MIRKKNKTASVSGKTRAGQNGRPEQEELIKGLVKVLSHQGLTVRREELKRGLGWKVQSGACRALNQAIIFVDRKSSATEQVAFLAQQVRRNGVEIPTEVQNELAADVLDRMKALLLPEAA